MTPSEKLAYLESVLSRKPHTRLRSAFDRLRTIDKADDLKAVPTTISAAARVLYWLRDAVLLGRA